MLGWPPNHGAGKKMDGKKIEGVADVLSEWIRKRCQEPFPDS